MPTSFKTASVLASFMMVLLSGLMALALAVAHIPFLFLGMAILSGFWSSSRSSRSSRWACPS